jgi:transposase
MSKREISYATNTLRLKPSRPEQATLVEVATRCSVLWNVLNYRCRQAFLAKTGVPGYSALDAEFKRHACYRALPSDIAQEVIKTLAEAWKSYFALREKWSAGALAEKPGLPKYRKCRRTGAYPADWIPIQNGRSYDATPHHFACVLPRDLRKEQGGGRLSLSYRGQMRYLGRCGRAVLRYEEASRRWYATISVEKLPNRVVPSTRTAAIDLGVRVLLSLSIEGDPLATHYSGRNVLADYDYWGRKIAQHQSERAHREQKSSRRLKRLHRTRRARLEHAWEALARDVVRRLERECVGLVYLGHPKHIRRDVRYSQAKWAERIHTFWSFERALLILEKHLRRAGIRSVRVGERGTSSTCPMDPRPEERSHTVVRRPRHRIRCTSCGYQAHSDQVGSTNILRFSNPGRGRVGLEASPRTETRVWNSQVWADSENQYLRRLFESPPVRPEATVRTAA